MKKILSLCFLLLLCGCATEYGFRAPEHPDGLITTPKAALLLPLSGPHKDLGHHMLQAAQMAIFETGKKDFELIVLDTKGVPSHASKQAHAALEKGAQIIIGPLFSRTTHAVAQAVDRQIPVVSFSNNEKIARRGVFAFGFSVEGQVDRAFEFMSMKGLDHVIAIVANSTYGKQVADYALDAARAHSLSSPEIVVYSNPSEMGHVVEELKLLPKTQVLYIPEGGTALKKLTSALLYHDVDLSHYQIIGSGQWDTGAAFPRTLDGSWYVSTTPRLLSGFKRDYRNLYGKTPPRLASLAYDAVAMASTLARTFPVHPYSLDNLTDPDGFDGLNDRFILGKEGQVMRALAVLQVKRGGSKVISSSQIGY